MTIAEMFVNLGVKGTEKTVGALSGVSKGLGEVKTASFEAKVGVLAAVYAFREWMSMSGQAGTNLTNFTAFLGESAKTLQEYQYAGRQVGITNQEVEGSFKSLQSIITKTLRGEGAPKGLARLAAVTGDLTPQDLDRMAKRPELMIQRLQEYAQKEKNFGLRNEVLKSFGQNDSMISGLARNAFRPDVLSKAPTYSEKELGALDRANIAWSNLSNKIQMAVGHFNARHGTQLVNDLSKIVDQLVKLAASLTLVTEKFKLFEIAAKFVEGLSNSLKLLVELSDKFSGKDSKKGDLLYKDGNKETFPGFSESPLGKLFGAIGKFDFSGLGETINKAAGYTPQSSITPPPPALPTPYGGKPANIEINQNLNFQHDGKDHKKTSDSVKKAAQASYRQMSAQGQWA